MADKPTEKPAAPAAATGPAGPHVEAKVAANAMLAMLRGAEPRGLPGKVFDRIDFQRAAEGRTRVSAADRAIFCMSDKANSHRIAHCELRGFRTRLI